MADISLDAIKKSYGRTDVIHGISLDIAHGEMIVLVGPSGCGKSTLLRMVAGLETVTGGEIRIAGKRVNELEPSERDIAMVFQNYALYPHMSVFDNMAYGLRIRGTPKEEIRSRVEEAAGVLQLEALLDRRPRQLSGGQRQRVAMGRAIVRKPVVFLFDEPLSNLDAKLRVQMRMEIKQLQQRLGVTAIYVTHDQVEAMTLADRMVVMNAGRAEQIGAPLDVYNDPATTFVAGFIGSPPMSFLDAAALSGALSPPPGSKTIGIRPETLRFCATGDALLTARPRFHEALGAETLTHLELEDGQQITVRSDAEDSIPALGETVGLDVERSRIFYFAEDGQRVG